MADRVVGVEALILVSAFKSSLRCAPYMPMWSPPRETEAWPKTRLFLMAEKRLKHVLELGHVVLLSLVRM